MADVVANISRGKIGTNSGLPGASDAFVIVVLEAVEADDTVRDYDDLAALLAAANTEATSTGYTRDNVTDITYSVDDTANTAKSVKDADHTWTGVSQAASESWVALLMCYDDDTGAGTDANIVPMSKHDFSVTPNGGDITADFDQTNGWWSSS